MAELTLTALAALSSFGEKSTRRVGLGGRENFHSGLCTAHIAHIIGHPDRRANHVAHVAHTHASRLP
jgi:hypothetical protein